MIHLDCNDSGFEPAFEALCRRPSYPAEIESPVRDIIERVRAEGDAALVEFAERFDHAKLTPEQFRVTEQEIDAAEKQLEPAAKKAILTALKHVQGFSRKSRPRDWKYSPRSGVVLGEQFVPMERVGVYIPGGTAPLVSTVIHTAGIAGAAGVREIVAVTPPGADGKVHPAVLFAMRAAGVTEIYRLGGVYGIAALAYGTPSIRRVEKIVGPGNAYVTAAKKLVYGQVAIDMVAGPSEIMVIADGSADAEAVAADLLSQAEHGSGLEQSVVVATDAALLREVEQAVLRQKASLPRQATVDRVLDSGTFFIRVKSLEQAVELAGRYAPEHLELCCRRARKLAKGVKAAGAIFIGCHTPEPIGDFCAGPSHVLPTAGSGRYFSGLAIGGFYRRMSLVEYSKRAIEREAPIAAKFAEMEGLDAHGRSAMIRAGLRID